MTTDPDQIKYILDEFDSDIYIIDQLEALYIGYVKLEILSKNIVRYEHFKEVKTIWKNNSFCFTKECQEIEVESASLMLKLLLNPPTNPLPSVSDNMALMETTIPIAAGTNVMTQFMEIL